MTLQFPKPTKTRKKGATAPEIAYLGYVKQLPCGCCQRHPCAAHHVICGRFSQSKTLHWWAIPLCDTHHQGMWDTRGPAIHRERQLWEQIYGLDTDYIAQTQREIMRRFGVEIPYEFRFE